MSIRPRIRPARYLGPQLKVHHFIIEVGLRSKLNHFEEIQKFTHSAPSHHSATFYILILKFLQMLTSTYQISSHM